MWLVFIRRTSLLILSPAAACADASEQAAQFAATTDSLLASITAEAAPDSFVHVPRQDPMTDVDQSYIYVNARGATSLSAPALIWRCQGPELELVIAADEFLTSDEPVRVQWRLGEGPASSPESWAVSTTGTGVFAPPRTLITLTERAATEDRLRVRLTDFRGTNHDLEFRLAGFGEALANLTCDLSAARVRAAAAAAAAGEQRRIAEEQRRAEAQAAAEAAEAERFIREHPFVGSRTSRTYMRTVPGCYTAYINPDAMVFFRSEEEARAAGYTRTNLCP